MSWRSSGSSMWPMRMSLPLCWMGGLLSNLRTRCSASSIQSLERMCPRTRTSLELPVRTVMDPEPVSICKFTAPLTCKVRSKLPSAAKAGSASTKAGNARAILRTKFGRRILSSFVPARSRVEKQKGTEALPRALERPGAIHRDRVIPLLQYDLVAFVQPFQDFGFGAIGNANVDGDLALTVFALGIRNVDGSVAVFVVNDCAFGDLENVLVF